MNATSTSTSTSDRYDAAREALAMHDAGKIKCYSNDPAERYDVSQMMAEALRALITPPETGESPEDDELLSIFNQAHYRATRELDALRVEDGGVAARRAGRRALFRAGILAAWESWEPETANIPEESENNA